MTRLVTRIRDGELLPPHWHVERVLATEDEPLNDGGTGSRRVYTVLVEDTRFWLSDAEKARVAEVAAPKEPTP